MVPRIAAIHEHNEAAVSKEGEESPGFSRGEVQKKANGETGAANRLTSLTKCGTVRRHRYIVPHRTRRQHATIFNQHSA